jgi:putative mRNA 3-end processing factor
MTHPTKPMIELLIEDSLKVNRLKGLKPTFSKANMKKLFQHTRKVRYSKKMEADGFSFKFEDAGHILGAASTEVDTGKHKIVYTGDIKFEKTRLHRAAYDRYHEPDLLIVESTYGDREHPPRREIEERFVEACWDICDSNGNVLVPAFAIGRAHEIIEVLDANNFDYPIYIDGMAKDAAEILFEYPEYLRDYRETYKALKRTTWVYGNRQRKKALEEPGVIVSTAGMLTGGPALNYLMKMRDLSNQAVFFSGYQAPQTPGRMLIDEKRTIIDDLDLDFSDMRVEYFDFSAHASATELRHFVQKVKPKVCVINHGEEEQSKAMGEWVKENVGCHTIVPKLGEKIDLKRYI